MAPRSAPQARVALVLMVSLLAVSAGGVLARKAGDMHPLAIAFWRTGLVGLALSPLLRRPAARDLAWIVLAGLFLAAHFWAWFSSLLLTSVMRSTVLVCLTPVWAGLLEARLFNAPPPRRFWGGIALALLGVVGMVSVSADGGGALQGDALAVLGGMLGACYFVVARDVRQRVDFLSYGALVCLAAAGWLALLAWSMGVRVMDVPDPAWPALLAMAIGPQLLGHVGLNFSMKYLPAARVSALLLLEPVGATLLAALLLAERPQGTELAGALVILAGVAVAARR